MILYSGKIYLFKAGLMRFYLLPSIILFILLCPFTAYSEVLLFQGSLDVITTSGKACASMKGNHSISMVISIDYSTGEIFGYEGGNSVTVGMLKGTSLQKLSLRYPYPDAERAEGHSMNIMIDGGVLTGELIDKHINNNVDDCNFDLARIKLLQTDNIELANTAYKRLSTLYRTQLLRSTALSIARSGDHAKAADMYEKALEQADTIYPADSEKLVPYLTGTANSYMRSGRYSNMILLYNKRIASLPNEAVRQIFKHHQVRALIQIGRNYMLSEDYNTALDNFRQAVKIDFKSKEAIAGTMSALVRSSKYDEAIAFLEETELRLENEPDKKDVREAIALVEYQKAKKAQKAGHTAEAENSLHKSIKLDPDTAYYLIVLARWTHKAGKYYEADTILKHGIDSFKDAAGRSELIAAREKLFITEQILARLNKAGE